MAKILKRTAFFIAVFTFFAAAGQFASGVFLLKWFGLPFSEITPYVFYDFYNYYGFSSAEKIPWMISTGIAFGLPAATLIIMVAAFLPSFNRQMKTMHGSARFATPLELKKNNLIYDENTKDGVGDKKHPPIILGKHNGKYIADYSQLYTSVAAAPGAGKGVGFVIPNLLQYPHSCVVLDPKKENWEITAGFRSLVLGQECFLFAPDANRADGYKSHRWNPLDYVSDDIYHRLSSIKQITGILIPAGEGENQSFYLGAQDLVNGLILYLVESDAYDKTLTRVLRLMRHEDGLENWIKVMAREEGENLSEDCKGLLLSYANNANPKGRDSIKNIALSSLSVFDSKTVAEATSCSDFRFEDLRKRKISIYVGVAPPSMKTYRKLLNLFFSQCIIVNTETLPENAPANDPLNYQCLMMIDEFPALGKVDIIRESSGYTRGYNMRYALIYQNRAQIEASELYGKEGASALLETMHNRLVLSADSYSDAEGYSKDLGNITIKEKSRSRQMSMQGDTTLSENYHKRELMLPQEIKNMPLDDSLILKMDINPIKAKKIYWFKDSLFKNRGNMPVPNVPSLVS